MKSPYQVIVVVVLVAVMWFGVGVWFGKSYFCVPPKTDNPIGILEAQAWTTIAYGDEECGASFTMRGELDWFELHRKVDRGTESIFDEYLGGKAIPGSVVNGVVQP